MLKTSEYLKLSNDDEKELERVISLAGMNICSEIKKPFDNLDIILKNSGKKMLVKHIVIKSNNLGSLSALVPDGVAIHVYVSLKKGKYDLECTVHIYNFERSLGFTFDNKSNKWVFDKYR
jgi:hypothetical protein